MSARRRSGLIDALAGAALVGALAGGVRAQRADIVVDAPSRLEPIARRVRGIDQQPLATALERAGLALPARVHVVLIPGDDPRARTTPEWIVGLAAGTEDVIVLPDRIGRYPYDSLESVVRHEIVHLALNVRAAGRPLPRWFHEGVAVTVESGWGARDELRLLLAAVERPSMADLRRLFASDAYPGPAQAYRLSGALVHELRERHGSAAPGTIAGEVAKGLPFDAAFVRVTGENVEQVASRAWASHRRLSRWVPVMTSPAALWAFVLALAALAFVARIRRRQLQRRRWDEEGEKDEAGEDGFGS